MHASGLGQHTSRVRDCVLLKGPALVFLLATASLTAAFAVPETASLPGAHSENYLAGRWEFSLESTYTFHIVSNPFHSLIAGRMIEPNQIDYHLATQLLALRYRLTSPAGPWFLRGSLECSATVVATAIVQGSENYFAGLALGFRYDFVQRNGRLVPFIELRGGPGVTDSRGGQYEQQQDLVFTYLFSVGLRYDLSRRWSAELGAVDQHLSDAYLTPRNYGFDSVGVVIGAFAHF